MSSPSLPPSTERLRRQLLLTWILMLLVTLMLAMPTIKLWVNYGVTGDPRPVTPRGSLAEFEQTTIEIFNQTSPSVVYINTRQRVADFWSRRILEVPTGTGSGFVWDKAGHIVTNFHVIEGASSAQVVFYDQSSYEAVLVGASPDHDLAVLRISAPETLLRPVMIGESRNLQVGQAIFAIGNPFGLNQTLTTGVLSAKSRTIESPSGHTIEDVLQVDAAINPGNSGGPLLDSAGRLIGVNTAIASPTGASAGVGFSIPVDTVNRVVPQLIAQGEYRTPSLGVYVNDELNEPLKRRLGFSGVLVLDVEENSAAERAGIRPTIVSRRGIVQIGDIIQAIEGEPVETAQQLYDLLDEFKIGDTVTVTILRDGKSIDLPVQLQ